MQRFNALALAVLMLIVCFSGIKLSKADIKPLDADYVLAFNSSTDKANVKSTGSVMGVKGDYSDISSENLPHRDRVLHPTQEQQVNHACCFLLNIYYTAVRILEFTLFVLYNSI